MSMGFSRQEYWNWLPCPAPGDLPAPGIKHISPVIFHPLLNANQGEKAISFQDLPSGHFFFPPVMGVVLREREPEVSCSSG